MSDNRRYYGLDALRGSMMLLGIVLHSAGFYITSPPPAMAGFPADRSTSYLFDLVFHFIHSFRMPLFFVLGGFFASLLVEKRGMWGTYKDRAARILAPMLAAIVTVLPLCLFFVFDFMIAARYGVMGVVPDRDRLQEMARELKAAGAPVDKLSILHLWFLLYLCYFYLLLPLCGWLARFLRRWERGIQAALGSPWMLVPLGLATAAMLMPYRGAQLLEGFIYFEPHAPSLAYYGAFFVLGYLFRHFPALLEAAKRHARGFGLAGAVLFPAALYASYLEYTRGPGGGVHVAAAIANGLCTWALVYFFIGAALRWFDYAATWILYASQSSYWVFLVHMPLVGLGGWWLARYDWPALVKFPLLMAFVAAACFASYHYAVQRSWVSRFLNGRRFDLPPPWKKNSEAAAASLR